MIAAVLRLRRALTPLALALLAATLALPLLGALRLRTALPVAHALLTAPLRHHAGLILAATNTGRFALRLAALPVARLLALAGALLRLEPVLVRPLAPSAGRAALVVAEPGTPGAPVAVAAIESRPPQTKARYESRPPETLGPRDEDPPPEAIDPEAAAEGLAYDAGLLDQTVSAQRRSVEGRHGRGGAARQHGSGHDSQDRQRICRFHIYPDPIKLRLRNSLDCQ